MKEKLKYYIGWILLIFIGLIALFLSWMLSFAFLLLFVGFVFISRLKDWIKKRVPKVKKERKEEPSLSKEEPNKSLSEDRLKES